MHRAARGALIGATAGVVGGLLAGTAVSARPLLGMAVGALLVGVAAAALGCVRRLALAVKK